MSKSSLQFLAGFALCGGLIAGGVAYQRCATEPAPTSPPTTAAQAATTQEEAPPPAATGPDEAPAPRPGLKEEPGVTYVPPKGVPKIVYEPYKTFDESLAAAQEGAGEFVDTGDDAAYRITHLDERSSLAEIGLRRGDKVIAVNGRPVGESATASRALSEAVGNEAKLTILIERDGKRQVLTYTTAGDR